jgi:hypothetical protein
MLYVDLEMESFNKLSSVSLWTAKAESDAHRNFPAVSGGERSEVC